MADQATKEQPAQPTVAELEAKVARLTQQVETDDKLVKTAEGAIQSAMKSNDLVRVLELSSARETAIRSVEKTASQLKTATGAITSAKRAANAGKIADIHTQMANSREVNDFMAKLGALDCKWAKLEISEETGKLIVNSPETTPKRASGGGGNGRGQPVTVDGTEFASANAALKEYFGDSGPLSRKSILSKLVNAGHKVS